MASLVLSIAAAHALGAHGLGVFGLLSGGVTLATAIATGLVGDSLTVLQRGTKHVRAGLQIVALSVSVALGAASAASCWAGGLLSWRLSLLFGLGSAVFVFEEFFRRLLMASLRFWSVMITDSSSLFATVAWLMVAAAVGHIDMAQILLALLFSQVFALGVAVILLPAAERVFVTQWRGADIRSVFRYGAWRAGQQGVRPGMLTVMRILVAVAAGTAAYGRLEGRTGVRRTDAPDRQRHRRVPLRDLRVQEGPAAHQIDPPRGQGCGRDVLDGARVGVVAVVFLPIAGHLVTGSRFSIDVVAVYGWVVYSASAGLLMPYGSLAAVAGMHVKVFWLRVMESVISLAAVIAVLFVFHVSPSWVPLAMTLGPVALAVSSASSS